MRMRGLLRKEMKHILRDPSAILIAFLMPLVLLLVLGFGISFDANHMPVALVADAPEEVVRGLLQAMDASPYLSVQRAASVHDAEAALATGQVRGVVVVREDFAQHLTHTTDWPATAALDVNATDPNTARILEGYVSGALQVWLSGQQQEKRLGVGRRHRVAGARLVQSGTPLGRRHRARRHRHGDDDGRHAADRRRRVARMGAWHDGEHARLAGASRRADPGPAGLQLRPGHRQHAGVAAVGGVPVRRAVPRRLARAGRRRVAVPGIRARLGTVHLDAGAQPVRRVADGVPDDDDAGVHAVRHGVRHRRHAALAAA